MKRLTINLLGVLVFFAMVLPASAQVSNKETSSQLKFKPSREVRKITKRYRKQGYYVAVGAPSLERQYTNMLLKQNEFDENNEPVYLFENTKVVGETQVAAKLQAMESGKLLLAGRISTSVVALIENNIANAQLNTKEANSVTQTLAAAKNLIAQEIGNIDLLVEMYKDINSNIEANLVIAYNKKVADDAAKKVIRKELEDKTNLLQEKLDKLMKF